MSSYNLKAKNRSTREIVEVNIIVGRYIPSDVKLRITYTQDEFNTLYEVIDDTPIEKGWREQLRAMFTTATYRVHDNGYVRLAPSEEKVFIDFISQVEAEAYKRGQEEAYRESAELVRNSTVEAYRNPYPTKLNISERDLQFTADGHNQACRKIAEAIEEAIEQLSSN